MALDPCTLAALNEEGCYDCLSPKQKLAVEIYFKTNTLNLNRGTDYTSDLDQLLSDNACAMCLSDARLESAKLLLAKQEAENNGLSDLTIATALEATKCLACTDEKTLRAALLLLECRIQEAIGGEAPQ